MIESPSPNHGPRAGTGQPSLVILHYTGMTSGAAALERLCDPASGVSCHWLIEEDGRLFRLVDESRRAWHAGVSFWNGQHDVNSASIGIELVNPGHEHGLRPFPDAQMASLETLLRDIFARHGLGPDAVLGHSDVAPTRKQDPGELFDWARLAAAGLALHPPAEGLIPRWRPTIAEFQQTADAIGYWVPFTERPDPETLAVLQATARRLTPEDIPSSIAHGPPGLLMARLHWWADALAKARA